VILFPYAHLVAQCIRLIIIMIVATNMMIDMKMMMTLITTLSTLLPHVSK